MPEETPKNGYDSLPENHPLRAAYAARLANAEAREEMTPREQQKKWINDKLNEVRTALRYGQRRTIAGWMQNADEFTVAEKAEVVKVLQEDLNFCMGLIATGREKPVAPVPGFLQ